MDFRLKGFHKLCTVGLFVAELEAVVITEFRRNLSKWEYKQCCRNKFFYISNELCFYGLMASIAKHAVAFNISKIQVTYNFI
jgi:hypothetical protein